MSRTLVVDAVGVHAFLPMDACIELMAETFAELARGEVEQPLRQALRPIGADGLLGMMPSYRGGARPLFGLKEVCVFPSNPARGLDTHLGAVLLHSGTTGELLAIVNASAVTAIRTAAVSALATRLLAREESHVLAIIGAGAQGESHLEAIPLVREIREVRVASRSFENARRLAARHPGGRAVATVEEAVRGADIVVTATSARTPIVQRDWIEEGTHINAVGSSVASSREIDGATVASASLFVDRRESAIHESGDYRFALEEGAIAEDHIRAELGDVVIGRAAGRSHPAEITLFKSLGLAIEDLAAASFIYDAMVAGGGGTWVEV